MYRVLQQINLLTYGYKSNKTGFNIGTKFEQYEDFYFNPSISSFYEKLTTSTSAASALRKQEGSNFDTSFNYALDYDKRNQRYMTTEGFRSNFSQKIPLISKVYSLGNSYELNLYNKLPNDMVTNNIFLCKCY